MNPTIGNEMKFDKSIVSATRLYVNDRFKMSGRMYQVSHVIRNPDDSELMDVRFHSVENPRRKSLMTVPYDTRFKIYVQ